MAGPKESDGGCLSILTSCFKHSDKTRPEALKSPKPTPAPKAGEPLAPEPLEDQIQTSTQPTIGPPVSQPVVPLEQSSTNDGNEPLSPALGSDPGSTTTLDLWQRALKEVDDNTRKWIESHTGAVDVEDPIPELVKLVQRSEGKHEEKAWRVKVGEREVVLRDYTSRVTTWLTTIGDIAINFAPAPSPAVWSAVKVLLKANVSRCEDLVAIMGCTDRVLCLVRRGKVYEEVYLSQPSDLPFYEDLRQKLVSAYKHCLEFLAFVDEELRHGNLRHLFDALLNPGNGEKHISDLKDLEKELELAARACEVKSAQTRSEELQKLLQSLHAPLMRIDSRVAAVLEKLEGDERERILSHISTIPVGIHHNEKHESRTKDTCEWLIRHAKFREWEDSTCSSVLWLQGSIGTGKSFLSSKVIDRYLAHGKDTAGQHDEGFAFFYCSRFDQSRQETSSILRSYIRQLSKVPSHSESIHKAVLGLSQDSKEVQTAFTLEKCRSTLAEIIGSYPRTILVLDALDECDEATKQDLAGMLKDLVENAKSTLKVFIASRKESDIEQYLEAFQSPQTLLSINAADNSGDIEKFVVDGMGKLAVSWQSIEEDTKLLVKTTLVEKGDGMFRWSYLQWQQLKKCRVDAEVRRRLDKIQKLPKTLLAAYDELYDQYEPDDIELLILQRAVRWVMCARGPLDSLTLLSAIRVESEKVDGEKALRMEDLTEHTLESVCQHLIVKDPALGVWKFPHASVAEYFKDKQEPWVRNAPVEITVCLIDCLIDCCAAYPKVWRPYLAPYIDWAKMPVPCSDFEAPFRRGQTGTGLASCHPLWSDLYSPSHLYGTAGHSAFDYSRQERLLRKEQERLLREEQKGLLRKGQGGPALLCEKRHQTRGYNFTSGYRSESSVLSPAHPLQRYIQKEWLNHTKEISVQDTKVACVTQALKRFLGGDGPQRPSEEYRVFYNYIAHSDWDRLHLSSNFHLYNEPIFLIVDMRLSRLLTGWWDQDLDPSQDVSRKLMKLAIRSGYRDVCGNLIDRGYNININNPAGDPQKSSMSQAILSGKIKMTRFLLERGADPNFFLNGRTLLYLAVVYAKKVCVKLLLEFGADPNLRGTDSPHGCPLSVAAYYGKIQVLETLVQHGAKVNPVLVNPNASTPLAAAVINGHFECTRLLLEHGADVHATMESKRHDYGSILAASVESGRIGLARLLIEHGADVDAHLLAGDYGSVLAAATLGPESSLAMIKYLVEEAHAELGQLTWKPASGAQGPAYTRVSNCYYYPHWEEDRAKRAKYLINERHVEIQVLVDIGLLGPHEVVDNALVISSTS